MPEVWVGFDTPIKELEDTRSDTINTSYPLHVTYLYLGKDYPEEAIDTVDQILSQFSIAYSPFEISLQDGMEIWNERFVVKLVTLPTFIHEARTIFKEVLKTKGLTYDTKFPNWKPHITVAKSINHGNLTKYQTVSLVVPCSKIFVKVDRRIITYYLRGNYPGPIVPS